MGVTIKKISEIAGVSRGTVDRVLNNRPGVKEEVRKRVMDIAEAMGYEPNIAGKALVKQNKPYNIGVILPLANDDMLYTEIKKGMEAAQKEYRDLGINVLYKYSNEYSVEDQINCIDSIVKYDISGLAFVPINNKRINERINLLGSNIPLVTFVTDIENIEKLCFIGIDARKSGRIAGDLLVKMLPDDAGLIAISTSKEVLAQRLRIEGLEETLKESGKKIRILNIYENYDREDLTFEGVMKASNVFKSFDGIYSSTGLGVGGLGKALRIIDPGRKIRVVTSDLIAETAELLKDNIIDFTITQQPYNIGYRTVKILSEYILRGVKPEKNIMTRMEIRTKENIKD